jgi:hypothetical protein
MQMEETGVTIQLAKKEYISLLRIVRDVEVLVGKKILLMLYYLLVLKMNFSYSIW